MQNVVKIQNLASLHFFYKMLQYAIEMYHFTYKRKREIYNLGRRANAYQVKAS